MPTFNDYYRVVRFKAHLITLAQMLRTLKLMRSGTLLCHISTPFLQFLANGFVSMIFFR